MDKPIVDVLLKDYELQRGYVQTYWTLTWTITAFLLTAAGAVLTLAAGKREQRWWVCVVPPIFALTAFYIMLMDRENYYANVYLGCVESQINDALSVKDALTWYSVITPGASGVRDYAFIPAIIVMLLCDAGTWLLYHFRYKSEEQFSRAARITFRVALTVSVIAVLGAFIWGWSSRSKVEQQVCSSKPSCALATCAAFHVVK